MLLYLKRVKCFFRYVWRLWMWDGVEKPIIINWIWYYRIKPNTAWELAKILIDKKGIKYD